MYRKKVNVDLSISAKKTEMERTKCDYFVC